MSHRLVPPDDEMRLLFREHPNRTDAEWARLWKVRRQVVVRHRLRLGIPSVRERRAILEGRA